MDHAATARRRYDLINSGDIDGFGDLLADETRARALGGARPANPVAAARRRARGRSRIGL